MNTTTARNGAFPMDARAAAELYILQGKSPIPLPTRSKDPGLDDWPRLRVTLDNVDHFFPADRILNLGLLNGAPSTNQADADLDCDEARAAALVLLPPTGWRFGRLSTPRAHWVYETDRPLDASEEKYTDLDGKCLVELRGTGGHTLFPPSVHPNGERITWELHTEPAKVSLVDLRRAVSRVAAAALLARHWPRTGSRQDAALALAGGLAYAGWDVEQIEKFLRAVVQAAGDEEQNKRLTVIERTVERLKNDEKLKGWPSLGKIIDGKVLRQVCQWLGITANVTLGKSTRRVRPLPPFQPFPVHCLPPTFKEMVETGAACIGCDPALLAVPALAVAAGCIGCCRSVLLKTGWVEPSVVWGMTVAGSGGHKTPAYHCMTQPLLDLQMDLYDLHKDAVEVYQGDLDRWQAKGRDERGEKPKPPAEPATFITSDTTIEGLGELHLGNPHGLLVSRDELDAWFSGFRQVQGQRRWLGPGLLAGTTPGRDTVELPILA